MGADAEYHESAGLGSRVNALERAKACAKNAMAKRTCRCKGVGSGSDESGRQVGASTDSEDWSQATAGRGGDQWDIAFLHAT